VTTATLEKETTLPETQYVGGLRVDRDILFSNHKSNYKKGVEKRQTRLIGKCAFLRPFLQKDEVVFLVSTGCSPVSVVEQLITGWIVFYLKRCLLVVTNKRILHVPGKPDFGYRNSIAQIRYGDCDEIRLKGRTLTLRYKSGKKEKFFNLDPREKKKLNVLLPAIPLGGEPGKTLQRTHLCPRCTNELKEETCSCSHCGLEFLNKAEGRRYALMLPGGGYFYARHLWMGISDAFVEFYLIFFCGTLLADLLKGSKESLAPIMIFGLMLAMEKTISVYHAFHFLKEFIPKDRKFKGPV
jgi:hypothetical protein